MENKEYVWWVGEDYFSLDRITASEEEAIEDACNKYEDEVEHGEECFPIDDETDEIIPIVNIGVVERLDKNQLADVLINDVRDLAIDYAIKNGFWIEEDDSLTKQNPKADEELKTAIVLWLTKTGYGSLAYAEELYEYDCEQKKQI